MKKSSVAGIFLIVLLIVSNIAAASSPTATLTTSLNGFVVQSSWIEQGADQHYVLVEAGNLFDITTGAVQLRALARLAPWLHLTSDDGIVEIENSDTHAGIFINLATNAITKYETVGDGTLLTRRVDGEAYIRNDRTYLLVTSDVWWQSLMVSVNSHAEPRAGGWTIYLNMTIHRQQLSN
jgi:hypothetical protein